MEAAAGPEPVSHGNLYINKKKLNVCFKDLKN